MKTYVRCHVSPGKRSRRTPSTKHVIASTLELISTCLYSQQAGLFQELRTEEGDQPMNLLEVKPLAIALGLAILILIVALNYQVQTFPLVVYIRVVLRKLSRFSEFRVLRQDQLSHNSEAQHSMRSVYILFSEDCNIQPAQSSKAVSSLKKMDTRIQDFCKLFGETLHFPLVFTALRNQLLVTLLFIEEKAYKLTDLIDNFRAEVLLIVFTTLHYQSLDALHFICYKKQVSDLMNLTDNYNTTTPAKLWGRGEIKGIQTTSI